MPLEHITILPYLDGIAKTQPTAIALEDTDGHTLSWADMSAKSKALAQALSKLGDSVVSHGRVGVLSRPQFFVLSSTDFIIKRTWAQFTFQISIPLYLSLPSNAFGYPKCYYAYSCIALRAATSCRPKVSGPLVKSPVFGMIQYTCLVQ